ncbi:MAG: hypothetical protein OHK0029_36040 [Armatimonadaceae bacterium]
MLASQHPLEIRLFGTCAIRFRGKALPPLRTRKGVSLLAFLALRAGQTVEREWLAGVLWPDSAPPQGLASLRRTLTDLRHVLGDGKGCIESPTSRTLRFDASDVFVDVLQFDAAVRAGNTEIAFTLYRGPLLEDLSDSWVVQEREGRLRKLIQLRTACAYNAERDGYGEEAVRHWQAIVAASPFDEAAQRGLMRALAVQQQFTAAIQVFREFCNSLRREFDVEPHPETTALFRQIRALCNSHPVAASQSILTALTQPSTGGSHEEAAVAEAAAPVGMIALAEWENLIQRMRVAVSTLERAVDRLAVAANEPLVELSSELSGELRATCFVFNSGDAEPASTSPYEHGTITPETDLPSCGVL